MDKELMKKKRDLEKATINSMLDDGDDWNAALSIKCQMIDLLDYPDFIVSEEEKTEIQKFIDDEDVYIHEPMKDEDYLDMLECPMCGRDHCIQELHCIDRNGEHIEFRCTYSDCGYTWINEEGTEILRIKKRLHNIINEAEDNARAANIMLVRLKETIEHERERLHHKR